MADPDILYQFDRSGLHPVHYQNDYLGIFQQIRRYEGGQVYANVKLSRDVLEFTRTWTRNISEQFGPEDLEKGPGKID